MGYQTGATGVKKGASEKTTSDVKIEADIDELMKDDASTKMKGDKFGGGKGSGSDSKIDYDLVKEYVKDIEEQTGTKIHKKQITELKNTLRKKEYSKLSVSDTAKHRAEFTQKVKNDCIEEWEKNTKQKWPRYTEAVYDKNGKVVRRVGDPYDAHHIIENCDGGDHVWWNMHPAKFPKEHQGGIHRKDSPVRKLFD